MTTETVHIAITDITPNRATVLAIGSVDDLTALYEDRDDVELIEAPAAAIGERIWIRRDGHSITFTARV